MAHCRQSCCETTPRIVNRREGWKFFGHMFSVRFLFPAPEWDDSLRELGRPVVQDSLDSVCREHKLDRGVLGTVTHYM